MKRAALVTLAMLAAAPAAAQTITDGKTPGGSRLAHIQLPDERDQSIVFFWRDRSALDAPDKAGLLQLAPNLIIAGGGARFDGAAMDEALKDYGAALALRRGATATSGELSAASRYFAQAADILADALSEPRLPPRVLAREKAGMSAAARGARERPDQIAGRALTRAIFGSAPARALFLLEPDVIDTIEARDIEAWRRAALSREGLVVAAAGPLDRDTVTAIVDSTFAKLPQQSEPRPRKSIAPAGAPRTIFVTRAAPQTVIAMGAAVRWPDREDWAARPIIASALGGGPSSRLWIAVRERLGAAYGASASLIPLGENLYRFSMQSSVSHAAAPQALAAIRAEYARLREEGLREQDVAPIRVRMIAAQADAMDHAASAARAISGAMFAGRPADAPTVYARDVGAMSAERVSDLARARLPERLVTVIVGPSPEGFGADCIVGPEQDVAACD